MVQLGLAALRKAGRPHGYARFLRDALELVPELTEVTS